MGLAWAGLRAWRWAPPKTPPQIFSNPTYLLGTAFLAILAVLLIFVPMTSAGDPNEPPPPAAMM